MEAGGKDNVRDWQHHRDAWVRILEKQTGEGLDAWAKRINEAGVADEPTLRAWLTEKGVTGYARTLLVMERFGYPDFLLASAEELIEGQYADRPELRPVFDAILAAARSLGDLTVQARKTYVSLVSPRRTFARIQPTTRRRVDLALRLDRQEPVGRLRPSKIHETTPLQISFTKASEVDSEALEWLRKAYIENS